MRKPDPLRVRDLVGHMADAERRLRELGDQNEDTFLMAVAGVPTGSTRHAARLGTLDPAAAGFTREDPRLAPEAENIEARPISKPMHPQPVFRDCEIVAGAVSEELFERGLCLPSGSAMTEKDLQRVVDALRAAADQY